MKKIEKVMGGIVVIFVIFVIFGVGEDMYYFITSPKAETTKPAQQPEPLVTVEGLAISDIVLRTSSNRVAEMNVETHHSNSAWLECEKMADGDAFALEEFETTAPKDRELAFNRKLAKDSRVEMIKKSRKGQVLPKYSWGKQLSDNLGIKPRFVRSYENGIAVLAKDSLYFFHNAALEISVKTLGTNTKIAVEKGKDGYWYPAIEQNGKKISLSYWGELN